MRGSDSSLSFEEYREKDTVLEFLNYFSECLDRWKVCYTSTYKLIAKEHREFSAVGVEAALENYVWPSSFDAPTFMKIGHKNYSPGDRVKVYRWHETREALESLSSGLLRAIENNDHSSCMAVCTQIVNWGMGNRGKATLEFLEKQVSVSRYLRDIQILISKNDLQAITQIGVKKMGSGLSKIHSLANPQRLAILDSRVALALGSCIVHFSEVRRLDTVPFELRVRCTHDRRPLGRSGKIQMPLLTPDHNWLISQIKMSWILLLVLEKCPHVFKGLSMERRLHSLEASLFMCGAKQAPAMENLPSLKS